MTRPLDRHALGIPLALTAISFAASCTSASNNERPNGNVRSEESALVAVTNAGAALPNVSFAAGDHSLRHLYVKKSGSNTGNNCLNAATPCQTIAWAISQSAAGDSIDVYADPAAVTGDESGNTYGESLELYAQNKGSETAPRSLHGVANSNGVLPRIVPTTSITVMVASSFWVFDSLRIDCANSAAVGFYALNADAHNLAIRNSEIHKCKGAAVELRNVQDVLVENNRLHDNQKSDANGRLDANGVTVDHGSKRILVRGNTAYNNSGDAVQCQGREQDGNDPTWDVLDLTVVNNTFYSNTENAVDVKSCNGVTIANNHFWGYDESENNGGNSDTACAGAAVVMHYFAQRVLVDGNRIHDSGIGITIGNESAEPQNIAIRRNSIYHNNQKRIVTPLKRQIKYNCGDGINVNRVNHLDIYQNTIDQMPHSGIVVSGLSWDGVPRHANNVRVWNNIVSNVEGLAYFKKSDGLRSNKVGATLEYNVSEAPGIYSEVNLFYRANGAQFLKQPSSTTINFATWKAQTGLDGSSAEGNPLFVASPETNGYATTAGSPARNTALLDNGNARTDQRCNGGADKGAIESDCGSTPPPSDGGTDSGSGTTPPTGAIWQHQFGTTADEYGYAAATDSSGNVFVGGYTMGTLAYTNQGGMDAVIAKYGSNGAENWRRQLGSAGDDRAYGIAVDGSGNAYLVGSTTAGLYTYSGGAHDAFIAKYDSTGNRVWLTTFGTSADDIAYAVAVSSAGNVYVTGSSTGALGGANQGGSDAWLSAFNTSGGVLWQRQLGNVGNEVAYGVSVDSSGNAWIAGSTTAALATTYYGGLHDLFAAKYNSSGSLQWSQVFGTTADDIATGIACDSSGNAFLAGTTTGSLGFNNQGGTDAFLVKISSTAGVVWSRQLGTAGEDLAYGVSVNATGDAFLTGTTSGAVSGSSAGGYDIFAARYTSAGARPWVRQYGGTTDDVARAISSRGTSNFFVVGGTTGNVAGPNAGGKDFVLSNIAQ